MHGVSGGSRCELHSLDSSIIPSSGVKIHRAYFKSVQVSITTSFFKSSIARRVATRHCGGNVVPRQRLTEKSYIPFLSGNVRSKGNPHREFDQFREITMSLLTRTLLSELQLEIVKTSTLRDKRGNRIFHFVQKMLVQKEIPLKTSTGFKKPLSNEASLSQF